MSIDTGVFVDPFDPTYKKMALEEKYLEQKLQIEVGSIMVQKLMEKIGPKRIDNKIFESST